MKKLILTYFILIFPALLIAQKDVTQFLGIPVDGYKTEMIEKLQSKGYTYIKESDVFQGEFNGQDVNIFLQTYNNKVWRIAIADQKGTDETNIKIRFNNLIQQFSNNDKYDITEDEVSNYTISEDEDISYEMLVNNKRYDAYFYQKPKTEIVKYAENVRKNDSISEKEKIDLMVQRILSVTDKQVWFTIGEISAEYFIYIYYVNPNNKASGQDL